MNKLVLDYQCVLNIIDYVYTFTKYEQMHWTNLSVVCNILLPWPGIQLMPPAVKVWRLNHRTISEVPQGRTILTKTLLQFTVFIAHTYPELKSE